MKIKAIKITNFLGVDELDWNPNESINILKGPKGSGKTSVLEAIEKAFSNQGRRTELIKHGEEEATLYVETSDGLEIDRRLRAEKSDYFRLRKEGEGIKSTEAELRRFLRGDIFRPLDFIHLSEKEQTDIILGMIKMDYDEEDVADWFGELPEGLNWDKHILQILKDIETKFYDERQEINREIRTLESQIAGIRKSLPANYDGDEWAKKNVQEYYNKVSEAKEKNRAYESAKALKENFEDRIKGIRGEAETKKADVTRKYAEIKGQIEESIRLTLGDIQDERDDIVLAENTKVERLKKADGWFEEQLKELEKKLEEKKKLIENQATLEVREKEETIQGHKENIAALRSELSGLGEKEELELAGIDKETAQKIEHEKERLGKAKDYLEGAELIDIEPLQAEADEVAEMQSYLREWDRMVSICDNQISHRRDRSEYLTVLIETAREKPSELITKHPLPIEGITVDEKGRIRINQTLLDGLSDGEKLEVATKIALQRMGDLKVMCLDGFEKLNRAEQEKLMGIVKKHDIQAFVTITDDTESGSFEIEEG